MKVMILIQLLSGPIRLHPTKIIKNDSHFTCTSQRTLMESHVITHSLTFKSLFPFSSNSLKLVAERERERTRTREHVYVSVSPSPLIFSLNLSQIPILVFLFYTIFLHISARCLLPVVAEIFSPSPSHLKPLLDD